MDCGRKATALRPARQSVDYSSTNRARELLVNIHDKSRRLFQVESVGPFITRSVSVQVFTDGENHSRIIWIIDILPNELADLVRENMEIAAAIMKRTLEN